jgi:hypothetical protein
VSTKTLAANAATATVNFTNFRKAVTMTLELVRISGA